MRKETFKVKCPTQITFGDPMYFADYSGAKLDSLVAIIKSPSFLRLG